MAKTFEFEDQQKFLKARRKTLVIPRKPTSSKKLLNPYEEGASKVSLISQYNKQSASGMSPHGTQDNCEQLEKDLLNDKITRFQDMEIIR